MISTLAVSGYRSLRNLALPLGRLNLVTGANGTGKSSLYRSLRLLAEAAQGGLVSALAREGGLRSTLWAGPEVVTRAMRQGLQPVQGGHRSTPVALKLGFCTEEFGYSVELGLPPPSGSAFTLDPEIKRECLWAGSTLRPAAVLVERRGPLVSARDGREWRPVAHQLPSFDSMLARCGDPERAPEVLTLREQVRGWRFYDHFRTDPGSPVRAPQVGTHTPALAHDGADLAAAIQTILEIGDGPAFAATVHDAFPGASVRIHEHEGRFELSMVQPGLLRPLSVGELSDGTLRYLLLAAALLSARPPELLVLNEPETSLHPDLLPALARLVAHAATQTQLIVVSHAPDLVAALATQRSCERFTLEKELGETRVAGWGLLDGAPWTWPAR